MLNGVYSRVGSVGHKKGWVGGEGRKGGVVVRWGGVGMVGRCWWNVVGGGGCLPHSLILATFFYTLTSFYEMSDL